VIAKWDWEILRGTMQKGPHRFLEVKFFVLPVRGKTTIEYPEMGHHVGLYKNPRESG